MSAAAGEVRPVGRAADQDRAIRTRSPPVLACGIFAWLDTNRGKSCKGVRRTVAHQDSERLLWAEFFRRMALDGHLSSNAAKGRGRM
jgi:hypothetical protein